MIPNVADGGLRWVSDLLERQDELEDILGVPLGLTLGCGAFGCVMQSTGPWVVKITSDPTEGNVWQIIQNEERAVPGSMAGFPRVRQVLRVRPDIVTELGPRPLHIIVREGAAPVFTAQDAISKRTLRELGLPANGYDPMKWFPYSPPPDTLMDELQEARVPARERPQVMENIYGMLGMLTILRTYRKIGRDVMNERWMDGGISSETRATVKRQTKFIMASLHDWWGSAPLARSLMRFANDGEALTDVHFLNIGWREKEKVTGFKDAPICVVVLDPGATFMDAEVEIEEVTLRARTSRGRRR
jgi:hypothetical protein